jgi:hypothetical protein
MKKPPQPITVARVFALHAHVAIFHCPGNVIRMVHIPTGTMIVVSPPPKNLFQLTHEFAEGAVKRTGALLG